MENRNDYHNEKVINDDREKMEDSTKEAKKLPEEKTLKKKIAIKKIFKIIILFLILFVVSVGISQYLTADKYEAVVKVQSDKKGIGVNPTSERLDFGDLPKGSSSMRFVTIANDGKRDAYIKIVKMGGISDLIEINRNNFILSAGKSEKIEFLLKMPTSADKEKYSGKIVIFKVPKI